MGTWENIKTEGDIIPYSSYEEELRQKLWKENKIRIEGYTFSEWKKEQESRDK